VPAVDPNDTIPAGTVPARWRIAVLLGGAAVLLAGLGRSPTHLNAEERCESIVRTMVETSDWLMPRYAGAPRVNKPPLFYWLSSLSCRACRGFALWAFRLPSAISAIGILLLLFAWGREMKAPREALVAAALLVLTYGFVGEGRRGEFEMLLAFLCGASLLCGYRAARRGSWGMGLLSAVLFGLAFLTKATPAFLFVGAPLAAWAVAKRRARVFLDLRLWGIVLLGLLLGTSWHLYLLLFHPETLPVLRDQLFLPFGVEPVGGATARHFEPAWWYLEEVPQKHFLLALFLPAAVANEWARRSEGWGSPWRFLLLSAVLPFVVLCFVPGKQAHYLLPILLPVALLAARAMVQMARGPWSRVLLGVPAFLSLTVILLAGLAAGWVLVVLETVHPVLAVSGSAAASGLALWGLVALGRRRSTQALAAAFLAGCLVWTAYFTQLRPLVDGFASGKIFWERSYDATAWRAKFERHPFLAGILHYHGELPGRSVAPSPERDAAIAVPFRFVAYGDSIGNPDTHARLCEWIAKSGARFVVSTGDLFSGREGDLEAFREATFGVRQRMAYYPVPGNHDVADGEAFREEFGCDQGPWERVLGGVHFYFLDSNSAFSDPGQLAWLKERASASTSVHNIAVFHHPPFSVKGDREAAADVIEQRIHPLLVQLKFCAAICGHDHHFYTTVRDGVRYVVTGGGGAHLYDVHPERMQQGDLAMKFHHYVLCRVAQQAITAQVVDEDGRESTELRFVMCKHR